MGEGRIYRDGGSLNGDRLDDRERFLSKGALLRQSLLNRGKGFVCGSGDCSWGHLDREGGFIDQGELEKGACFVGGVCFGRKSGVTSEGSLFHQQRSFISQRGFLYEGWLPGGVCCGDRGRGGC
jgi:hypothetical protein